MKKFHLIAVLFLIPILLHAQEPQEKPKLRFNADFRFRIEEDWDSRKSDGSLRANRTRLRYRVRAGLVYANKWYSSGFRIRTGDPKKQQDPQLTLGDGFKEFGTLPIGFEKAYFKGNWEDFGFWVGKNSFPFVKTNELFWSDNVYPEGVFAHKDFVFDAGLLNALNINGGHFILATQGKSLAEDAYFRGLQTSLTLLHNRLKIYPSFYRFKNIPNIPDGNEGFRLDYAILHLGMTLNLLPSQKLGLTLDYYNNLEDYTAITEIPTNFKEEGNGFVLGLQYGALKQKEDWLFTATYAYLQQYAAVDFMAQNDWARWDYSSSGSPDGRLTNYKGVELVVGYKIDKHINLKTKYYTVSQLVPYGIAAENGQRIRFDIDIKL